MRHLLFLLLITTLVCIGGCAPGAGDHEIMVAFYNCENLFDTLDDPAKEDEDFTPQGKYNYTQRIYEQKLRNIATVIQSMGPEGPAIIGLAEVENSTVLNDLTRQPELQRADYKFAWFDGPDPRGINVALLYNTQYFSVISSEPLHVDLSAFGGKSVTRDVLHVFGILSGDTIDLLVNHWPSRRGGEDASDDKRAAAAGVDKEAIATIQKIRPAAKIILMGDLNDNPTDNSIAAILGAKAEPGEVAETGLYNPWTRIYKSGAGTEAYRGSWNLFDQVIISGSLLTNKNHKLHYEKAAIYRPGFITDHYKGHDGEPHRSFAGTHWINGFSDHFPVILYLSNSNGN